MRHKPAAIRRNYGGQTLHEDTIASDPIEQFERWFAEILAQEEERDPTAMVLSTVDEKGCPDSRVLLLKGLESDGFIFFTNYGSIKARQLHTNIQAALNFYWSSMARQVRVRGEIKRLSAEESEAYFRTRPRESQLSALASAQSQIIPSRKFLEDLVQHLAEQYGSEEIPYPKNWGGYCLQPEEIEFWQGRDNRLHDRIKYFKKQGVWEYHRLAP